MRSAKAGRGYDRHPRARGVHRCARFANARILQGNAPWVAQITGLTTNGYFVRKWVNGDVDYSRANSVGSRGVFRYYPLRSGRIYEVAERLTWKRSTQYFCRVNDAGEIVRLMRHEVLGVYQGARHAEVQAIERGIGDAD